MCGIVGIIQREPRVSGVSLEALAQGIAGARQELDTEPVSHPALARAADAAEAVAGGLSGASGVVHLVRHPDEARALRVEVGLLQKQVIDIEAALDETTSAESDSLSGEIVRLNDALWSIEHDRFELLDNVLDLAGDTAVTTNAIAMLSAVECAFASLDRLEVRGRDSAGILLVIRDHGLDLGSAEIRALLDERRDPTFSSFSVREQDDAIAVVYKAAREVGDLGQNTKELREKLRSDPLLPRLLTAPDVHAVVLAHTRWASVGLISEPNAHPVSGEEISGDSPQVFCAINGDIDNHSRIRADDALRTQNEITTDSKVFPVLVARSLGHGVEPLEAFRDAARRVEGSVAIAAHLGSDPSALYLALKGSGQGLYVGLADDCYVVASEPYGVVGMTQRYLRLQGGDEGEVVVLDGSRAGSFEGLRRFDVEGGETPPAPDEVRTAEITTRDIDRAGFPHFLLKEISQSPRSFQKTIRGKVVEGDRGLTVKLPPEALPPSVKEQIVAGRMRRIIVTGQGTASVAAEGIARFMERQLAELDVQVRSMPATELSGFFLRPDMSDTLVVAVSQSGTTTDTNRTVDLVRGRGATVVGIVNRRNSDLTDRCEGVVYTSDGRDVEMSVASTKAFYAQVAAGFLLALAILDSAAPGRLETPDHQALLAALRDLPSRMEHILNLRSHIADIANELAPARANWAVAGNGDNVTAAREIRIKMSELCYKSVASDVTEDKKHIDLSSEPLVVVCAAGLTGPQLDDVKKELAIFVAHKAAPVAIVSGAQEGFPEGAAIIPIPETHPALAFVLAAMTGQLFSYEAALSIEARARPLREIRGLLLDIGNTTSSERVLQENLSRGLSPAGSALIRGLMSGEFDSALATSTGAKLMALLRYACGMTPLEFYEEEWGGSGRPSRLLVDLGNTLTKAVDELSRPIDAIRHQAKTVTVGTSRSEDELFTPALVQEVLQAGVPANELSYRVLSTLASLSPAISRVTGQTLYRVSGDPAGADAEIEVVSKQGAAADLPSRTERDPVLKGTKRRVALDRDVLLTRGRADGRVILIVPTGRGSETVGLCLLHVETTDRLPASVARAVLNGYHNRLEALRDTVLESESSFSERTLEEVETLALLTEPLPNLAERWKA